MKKFFWIALLIIAACTPAMNSGDPAAASADRYSVDIPAGWHKVPTDKYLLITKDGPFYQYVLVQVRPLDKAFGHTRKKLHSDMLPQEAAQVIIDEISSDRNILNFKLIENVPALIDGHQGFKFSFTCHDAQGSLYKTVYYGFIRGRALYNLRYRAESSYYFQKDFATFQKFLNSFKLIASQQT